MRTGGIVKAKCERRNAKLWVAALRLYCLIDRLLADEAVFFARGSQECEPYNQALALVVIRSV